MFIGGFIFGIATFIIVWFLTASNGVESGKDAVSFADISSEFIYNILLFPFILRTYLEPIDKTYIYYKDNSNFRKLYLFISLDGSLWLIIGIIIAYV